MIQISEAVQTAEPLQQVAGSGTMPDGAITLIIIVAVIVVVVSIVGTDSNGPSDCG